MKSEKNLLVIDNRTESEFSVAHIPGSLNIPPESFPLIASLLPADKGTPLIFYCSGLS